MQLNNPSTQTYQMQKATSTTKWGH